MPIFIPDFLVLNTALPEGFSGSTFFFLPLILASYSFLCPFTFYLFMSLTLECVSYRSQVLSHSVMSHSLQAHGPYIACQTPQSMGILQARVLEWAAMLYSRESSQPRYPTLVSCNVCGFCTI